MYTTTDCNNPVPGAMIWMCDGDSATAALRGIVDVAATEGVIQAAVVYSALNSVMPFFGHKRA
jgi:hypothetical protein